ncbi:MAG: DUF1456 family protein [Sulfurovum sp.]|nr:DUF1456 family protein [Sulfurovum sp.]
MPVKTNEVLYRIQQALNLTPEEMLEAYALAKYPMTREHLEALLKRKQDKDALPCSYEELGVFLDGLILLKRGPSPKKSESDEVVELTNNLILKKLRIALELKEPETELIFNMGDVMLTKQELKSLFRNENHKNFKSCPDALLLAFLEGLEEYNYVPETE